MRLELKEHEFYSHYQAFASMVGTKKEFLSKRRLQNFLSVNGFHPYLFDLQAIMRRLDHDADGRLKYSEFVQAMALVRIPAFISISLVPLAQS